MSSQTKSNTAIRKAPAGIAHFGAAICVAAFLLSQSSAAWQQAVELKMEQPVEREIQGEDAHHYRVMLGAGQLLHVVVEQRGVDVAATLLGPGGKKLLEVDSPSVASGPEAIFFVAQTDGYHQIEIRLAKNGTKAGKYQINLAELRASNANDLARVAAYERFTEALLLDANSNLESKKKAFEKFEEALRLWQQTGYLQGQADSYHHIGYIYELASRWQQALNYYDQALAISRALADREREARTVYAVGRVYRLRGDKQKAIDSFNQSLSLYNALNNLMAEANTLCQIGDVHRLWGEAERALDYYHQAIIIYRAEGELSKLALTFSKVGAEHSELGQFQKALDSHHQSLSLYGAGGHRSGEASALMNIGREYLHLYDHQQSLAYLDRALQIYRELKNRYMEGYTLHFIGMAYAELADYQMALKSQKEALQSFGAVKSPYDEAITLCYMSRSHFGLGDKPTALGCLDQAWPLRERIKDLHKKSEALDFIGHYYSALGENQKALDSFTELLDICRAIHNRRREAITLNKIGAIHYRLGRIEEALNEQNLALALSRASADRLGELKALAQLSTIERGRGNLAAARASIEKAIAIEGSLRAGLENDHLRTSYSTYTYEIYQNYVDLLMQLHTLHPDEGHNRTALEASERARSRVLLEMLSEAHADIRKGLDPKLLESQRAVEQSLSRKVELRMRLLAEEDGLKKVEALDKEIEFLQTRYQELRADIRRSSPRYAALTQPQPLKAEQIQQEILDDETVLLEYFLGTGRSFLWVVTRSSIHSLEIAEPKRIEAASQKVYELLTARNRRPFEDDASLRSRVAGADALYASAAAELSQMVLGAASHLIKNKKRLLIVGDGALQHIPFSALPAPRAASGKGESRFVPLVVDHEIINAPSVSVVALIRKDLRERKPAPKAIAVLADPVFDLNDPRVSGVINSRAAHSTAKDDSERNTASTRSAVFRLAAEEGLIGESRGFWQLPYSRLEADSILSLVPKSESKRALGFDASKATAMSPDLSQYRYIHFATHSFINRTSLDMSGIVLSLFKASGEQQDGYLKAFEIFNLNLPAEMVVLSACSSGMGKQVRGEGLVGITRGFMYAGAARVAVSLWDVDDEATAELMGRMYRKIFAKPALRPLAALRAAQIDMWNQRRWAAPYYWAGFIVQGEWK